MIRFRLFHKHKFQIVESRCDIKAHQTQYKEQCKCGKVKFWSVVQGHFYPKDDKDWYMREDDPDVFVSKRQMK